MSDPYAVDHQPLAPPRPTPLRTQPVEPDRVRRHALWALGLGLVGVLVPGCSVGALVLGYSAAADTRRFPAPDPGVRGLAVTAIVLGWLGVVVTLLMLAVVVFVMYGLWSVTQGYY